MSTSHPDAGDETQTDSVRSLRAAVDDLSRVVGLLLQPTDLQAVSDQWHARAARARAILTPDGQLDLRVRSPNFLDLERPDAPAGFDPRWPVDR